MSAPQNAWYPHLVFTHGEDHQALVEDWAIARRTTVETLLAEAAQRRLRRRLDGD